MDFELTAAELRVVVRFALAGAEPLLPRFEAVAPDDPRPRSAIEAARVFVEGAARSRLQRAAATDAHRAARQVDDEVATLAARAAGDAAAAAYLHPIARATQVGHLLRATACAARVAELQGHEPHAVLAEAAATAGDELVAVLLRYPPAPRGRGRVAELMHELDERLRVRAA